MDLHRLRNIALTLLTAATNGARGRSEDDPVYQAVTEHRDFGARYSSCGDLAHWLLFRLGIRSDYLNRREHLGWSVGANVSRLAWKCPAARSPISGETYQAGDTLIVWSNETGTDAHVVVVREHNHAVLITAEYGQPGGAQCARLISGGRIGHRRIQKVVPLIRALELAAAAGELQPPEPALTWELRLGLVPALRRGARGFEVAEVQRRLNIDDDGDYGPITEEAVKRFQLASGIEPSGVVSVQTLAAIVALA